VPGDPVPLAEFAALYSQVDCVVHPSKGEGFGLIPFQAIACECPVIAPAVTGMADYLNDSNAIILKTGGRTRGVGLGNAAGHYYAVDENHLRRSMRYVLKNWSRERARLKDIGPAFRKQHAWPNALSGLASILQSLLADGTTTAGKRRVLSSVSLGV
jgi:glycosyltransferase involved in cell wall biosynthesis